MSTTSRAKFTVTRPPDRRIPTSKTRLRCFVLLIPSVVSRRMREVFFSTLDTFVGCVGCPCAAGCAPPCNKKRHFCTCYITKSNCLSSRPNFTPVRKISSLVAPPEAATSVLFLPRSLMEVPFQETIASASSLRISKVLNGPPLPYSLLVNHLTNLR